MCTTGNEAGEMGLRKPSGPLMIPSRVPDAGHKALRFGVCTPGVWSCFYMIFPFYIPALPFRNEDSYTVPLYVEGI